ncbi:MAG: ATP-binding protein [Chloroflexi bacterium]|nr:ATP-binding protein [Chloroflexota bacterium]
MELSERKTGTPKSKEDRSFLGIVENFTDPREILREGISNALDWGASTIKITVYEDATRADKELVIKIRDNGLGLTRERFFAFWNLADSPGLRRDKFGRKLGEPVGEKGYGTKTFWKCRQIEVESVAKEEEGTAWHVLGEMKEPINILKQGKVPQYEYAEGPGQGKESFTEVTIKGYHTNSKEDFRHETLKDYAQWFTKFGSVELELSIGTHKGEKLELQGLGRAVPELIPFGHPFPPVSNNIKQLQKRWQDTWKNYYVNKWVFPSVAIEGYPSSSVDVVFYLEGDSAKRLHNTMLTRRGRTAERWHYNVADRYGLYVCKDWIPLPPSQRVNEWVLEKSEWTLYHAFVNCQDFALTANRASIGNTDRQLLIKVREAVEKLFKTRIKASEEYKAYEEEIESTKQRGAIESTEEGEKDDLDKRYYHVKKKRLAQYQSPKRPLVTLVEPRQEVEVLMLYSVVKALRPDLFEFEIVDYSTSRGIDALCVLESPQGGLQKGNLRYVEFKRALTHEFRDHTFARLAAIVCWECNLENGAKVSDFAGKERILQITKTDDHTVYMLLAPPELPANNIKVYALKDYLNEKLGISFKTRVS